MAEAALTQLQLLQGISRGRGELWRILDWTHCEIGSATEQISIETVRYSKTEIEAMERIVYFDARAVAGAPHVLHPMACWRGPAGSPILPFELGWLHFNKVIENATATEGLNQTIKYGGAGAKADVYVYEIVDGDGKSARDAELQRATAAVLEVNPKAEDRWPVAELGPFAIKSFLSSEDLTLLGVAVCASYYVKVRLTFLDDSKMRKLMNSTLNALVASVQQASAVKH